ncbi:uncharacterized protein SAPINGB_P002515 [Magnusiomyces paraingens]|uniref:Uncharacterized protein n=1 Tax=Magnusiomyces paraingens TaxID=2606893 RepID=A0A5E8BGE9_9ASCO|nr:uncharacterized protein SAPINGB_P002515 [Saprochaete ingens]VVT49931.1 unnamed protein product [Saprochaete ingens]
MEHPNQNGQPPSKMSSIPTQNSRVGEINYPRFLEFDCSVNPSDFGPSQHLLQHQNPAKVTKNNPYTGRFRVLKPPQPQSLSQRGRETCEAKVSQNSERNTLKAFAEFYNFSLSPGLFNELNRHLPNKEDDLFKFERLIEESSSSKGSATFLVLRILDFYATKNSSMSDCYGMIEIISRGIKRLGLTENIPSKEDFEKYLVDYSYSSIEPNLFGSGSKKVPFCANYCCAFTGDHKNDRSCPHCFTTRSDDISDWYISPIPMIRKLFLDPKICEIFKFPHKKDTDYIRDVWDGDYIHELESKGIGIRSQESDAYAKEIEFIPLFFGLMVDSNDGFWSETSEVMNASLVLYNVPINMRDSIKHFFPVMNYPKRKFNNKPINYSSFLQTIVDDFNRMKHGFIVRTGNDSRYVMVTCHLVYFNGDMTARPDAAGIVAPSGNFSCFNCYIPTSKFGGKPSFIRLDPNDPNRYLQNIGGEFQVRNNQTYQQDMKNLKNLQNLQKLKAPDLISTINKQYTGIRETSSLLTLKTISLEDSFPPDAFNLLFENLEREFLDLLLGVPLGNTLYPCKNFPMDLLLNMEARAILGRFFSCFNQVGLASKMMDREFNLHTFFSGKIYNLVDIELKTILEIFPVFVVLLDNVITPKQRTFIQLCCDMFCVFRVFYMEAIPRDVLKQLEPCIKGMVKRFEELTTSNYTKPYNCCTLPLHTLLHIVKIVERTGNPRAHWTWRAGRKTKIIRDNDTKRISRFISESSNLKMQRYGYNVFMGEIPVIEFGEVKLQKPYMNQDFESTDNGERSHLSTNTIKGLIGKDTEHYEELTRYDECLFLASNKVIKSGSYARVESDHKDTFSTICIVLDLISYKTEDGDLVEMAVIKKIKSSGLFHVKGSKESFSFTEDGMDLLTYNVDPLTFELPMLVETSKLLNPIYFVDADMMFPNNPGSFYLNFFLEDNRFAGYTLPSKDIVELFTFEKQEKVNEAYKDIFCATPPPPPTSETLLQSRNNLKNMLR